MAALELAMQEFKMRRLEETMRRAEGAEVKGDFAGSVVGKWKELAENGAGVVIYKGREYPVRSIGFSSLPKGTAVELTYAKGQYLAKF